MRLALRSAAIVIKDNQLLVMHRINKGKEYWVVPGGGVEEGETIEQATVRELFEETSLAIKINRLIYHRQVTDNPNLTDEYYYLADYLSGEPKLNVSTELEEMQAGEQVYEPHWLAFDQLESKLLYPHELKTALTIDLPSGFSDLVREL